MMSTNYTTAPHNARTYGRKGSAKRKQSDARSEPRKRHKLSEEPTEPKTRQGSRDDRTKSPSPALLSTRAAPSTPRLARDLSGIFQSFSPKSPPHHPSPTKLASRMLARSKTESSIESSSSANFERTPSLPSILSSSPPKPPSPATSHIRLPSVPTNTRTYAGKSRSFLVAIPTSSLGALDADQEDDEFSRESYASLRSRWGVDNSEDDPYPNIISPARSSVTSTPNGTPSKSRGKKAQQEAQMRAQMSLPSGMMNPLKSITELRSKGESRRFLDEVGYLLEGMDSSVGIGLRRASALEITTKMCDAEFSRKAKAADFLSKAWDAFGDAGAGKGEDKILDTLLTFFVALVSRDPASLRDLALRPPPSPTIPSAESSSKAGTTPIHDLTSINPLVDTLFSLLASPVDYLSLISLSLSPDKARNETELRKLGIGKKDRGLFQTIHDNITSKSSLFPDGAPISTSYLILHAIQSIPPALIPPWHFPTLLNSLHHTLSPMASSYHLSWPDQARDIPFELVNCHLRLLDVYLLGQWGSGLTSNTNRDLMEEKGKVRVENEAEMERARDEWLVDGLVALGVCAELAGGGAARECMDMIFRVLVSLTHADESWALKVIDSECAVGFILRTIIMSRGKASMKKENGESDEGVSSGKDKGKIKAKETEGHQPLHDSLSDGTRALDTLCLALGLLTNLVQVVDKTKDILRDIHIDPTCTLKKRVCIRSCICPKSTSALDILVELYTSHFPHPTPPLSSSSQGVDIKPESPTPTPIPTLVASDPNPDALFLRGHLAVLFGLLIRGSPANQAHILNALGGTPAVERLVEHAREFVAFYTALGAAGAREDTVGDAKVARDVVEFLDGLRRR